MTIIYSSGNDSNGRAPSSSENKFTQEAFGIPTGWSVEPGQITKYYNWAVAPTGTTGHRTVAPGWNHKPIVIFVVFNRLVDPIGSKGHGPVAPGWYHKLVVIVSILQPVRGSNRD